MKHKHAEVLIAIAEGREVEFNAFNELGKQAWVTFCRECSINPISNDNFEWRVKKVPVIEVRYFKKALDSINGEIVFYKNPHGLVQWDMKVTFEDGIAVKAEFPFKVKIEGLE